MLYVIGEKYVRLKTGQVFSLQAIQGNGLIFVMQLNQILGYSLQLTENQFQTDFLKL